MYQRATLDESVEEGHPRLGGDVASVNTQLDDVTVYYGRTLFVFMYSLTKSRGAGSSRVY
jgi:hypothetical protein